MAIEVAEKKRKGPLSEEEKEVKKQQRQAQKQAELLRKQATASAAKLLPGLKAVLQKVADKIDRMGASYESLPEATQEQVTEVSTDLTETIAFATKLLDSVAKGKPLTEAVPWGKEKDLAAKIKAGNEAVRAIADFQRAAKPAPPKGRGGGKK
jgi:deferrochelatase/peroxidase EfeB